jgi:hypothetical protein
VKGQPVLGTDLNRSELSRRRLAACGPMSVPGHERRISPFRNRSALLPNSGRGADIPEPTLSAKKATFRHQSRWCEGIICTYSITLSARNSSDGGIVSPIAFAVRKLTTSSSLVGCSMGRSAGRAPRKILSTRTATRR